MKNYNIVELFSGTGGFSKGFENYAKEFKVLCAIDILEVAAQTTAANHKDCFVINEDIRKIRPSTIANNLGNANVDVIIGGPPCQGFSSLRPFRSSDKDDPRNSLFEQFALFVNYFQPKVFVMENVVGLLTHNNGKTLMAIQQCFTEMKYETDWRILNAANYGVPQKRERFILIGVKKGGHIKFPDPTHAFNGKGIGYRDRAKMISGNGNLPKAITVMEAIGDLPPIQSGESADYYNSSQNEYQLERRKGLEKLTLHSASTHSAKLLEIMEYAGDNINCIPKHLITSGFSSCYSRLRPEEPATTITVKFTSPASSKCIHPFQNRAITPREAARIQGFDDEFIFCGSKTDIVTQIGNAVPPILGKAVAKSVYEILSEFKWIA